MYQSEIKKAEQQKRNKPDRVDCDRKCKYLWL